MISTKSGGIVVYLVIGRRITLSGNSFGTAEFEFVILELQWGLGSCLSSFGIAIVIVVAVVVPIGSLAVYFLIRCDALQSLLLVIFIR